MELDASIATIMTSPVEFVEPSQKLIDIKHLYEKQEFHSHIPVVKDDAIVGIISLINFMRAIHYASLDDNEAVYHELTVEDIMTRNPETIQSSATIREAAEILAKGQFHSVIIEDEGKLTGMLTTTDILRNLIND